MSELYSLPTTDNDQQYDGPRRKKHPISQVKTQRRSFCWEKISFFLQSRTLSLVLKNLNGSAYGQKRKGVKNPMMIFERGYSWIRKKI